MKRALLLLLSFFTAVCFSQVPDYYNGIDFDKTGDELFAALAARIIATHQGIPYTSSSTDVWDACKLADEDPEISSNVLLIYGFDDNDDNPSTDRTRDKDLQDSGGGIGVWNREHVFARSLASPSLVTDNPGPGTDVQNLRPADRDRNSLRSNRKFTDGSGNSYVAGNGGWYPGDEWKGDVARIIMYMYLRYHGNGSSIAETNCYPIDVGIGNPLEIDSKMIDLFINWNVEDPVSDFERNKNEALAEIQKNRNPFIDNPYLATLIWGGLAAEDLWWSGNSSDTEPPSIPTNLVASNITDESFELSWTASTDNNEVYDYWVFVNGVYDQSVSEPGATITNLTQNTAYNITVKARDASANLSEESSVLVVTTDVGPTVLFSEDFSDCGELKFFSYNEASNRNWNCEVLYGENNSGSMGINGYQQDVLSKDWLITIDPIDFDEHDIELLSFYADAAYGTTPLELVYSADYGGSGDPSSANWQSMPNVVIPTHSDGSGNEEVFIFTDVDISSITGQVYVAFKYYSDNAPTRWTVDSFEISAPVNEDSDGDGILNSEDNCPSIANADQLDTDGDGIGDVCDQTPTGDDDEDGVDNAVDNCPNTANTNQLDSDDDGIGDVCDTDIDNDGIDNAVDNCPNTANANQLDTDNDGIGDQCDDTPTGDSDNDGIDNAVDNCPITENPDQADTDGDGIGDACDPTPTGDDDNDGIDNAIDNCPNTANTGQEDTDNDGEGDACDSTPNGDDDNDGIDNAIDNCPSIANPDQEDTDNDGEGDACDNTPTGDDDGDGVDNAVDNCPNTANNDQADTDNDGIGDVCDATPNGDDDEDGIDNAIDNCLTVANADQTDSDNDGIGDACDPTPTGDDDQDGVDNAIDQCANTPLGSEVDAFGCFVLPSDNFSIETTGETCAEEENGQIAITAENTSYQYEVMVNGSVYGSFFSELVIEDLPPDSYELCISVTGTTFKQCYSVTIDAGTTVGAKTSIGKKEVSVTMTSGTAPYQVFVNTVKLFTTWDENFSFNVNNGDVVSIKTEIECEGIYSEKIVMYNDVLAYPNPTSEFVEILVPAMQGDVSVEIYAGMSQLIRTESHKLKAGRLKINLASLPTGMYFIKLIGENEVTFKVLKN